MPFRGSRQFYPVNGPRHKFTSLEYARRVMIRSILIVLGSAIALAGCSSLPAPKGPATARAAACPRSAGHLKPDACPPFGRSYSQQDLRQTGHLNLARALQALDPSVTATGGP